MRSLCSVSMRVCVCVRAQQRQPGLRACISDDFTRYAFIYDQCCPSSRVCVWSQGEFDFMLRTVTSAARVQKNLFIVLICPTLWADVRVWCHVPLTHTP